MKDWMWIDRWLRRCAGACYSLERGLRFLAYGACRAGHWFRRVWGRRVQRRDLIAFCMRHGKTREEAIAHVAEVERRNRGR